MKSSLIGLLCLAITTSLIAQITPTSKQSTEPVVTSARLPSPTQIYAIIVGVSKYRVMRPELSFAHKDAQDFLDYVRSEAGGKVPDANIEFLTDSLATSNQVELAFSKLQDKIGKKQNVKVILFFSMHGGTGDPAQRDTGYLFTYDSDFGNLAPTSYSIDSLQKKVRYFSDSCKAQVDLYIDACRSGMIMKNEKGINLVAVQLLAQWENVNKIVSCSPDQYSYEGVQWQNGIFTHYLLKGLRGMADMDDDEKVTAKELEDYLYSNVTSDLMAKKREDAQSSQYVQRSGREEKILAIVHPPTLATLKANLPLLVKLSPFSNKGAADSLITHSDAETRRLYADFQKNIQIFELRNSAVQQYEQLISKPHLARVKGILKREMLAALLDASNKSLLSYLQSEFSEVSQNFVEEVIDQLNYVGESLGEKDYRYTNVMVQKLFFQGVYNGFQNDTLLAEQRFWQAIKQDSLAVFAYHELGALIVNFKPTEAVSIFEKAITIAPQWSYLYNGKGNALNALKKYEAAIDSYDQAIFFKKDYPEAYYNRGNALNALKKYEAAIDSYDQAISFKKDYPEAYYNRGNALNALKKYEAAIDSYDQAISFKKDFSEAYYNRGNALNALKKYEAAIESYDQAIFFKKDFSEAYYNRGTVLVDLKKYEAAIDSYDQAIFFKKDFSEAYYGRGTVLVDLKKYEAAIDSYDQAIFFKKDFSEAYNNRGTVLEALKKYEAAIDSYDQAISFKKDFSEAYNNRGVALYALKKYEAAIDSYDQAIFFKKDFSEAYNNRGTVLNALKKYEAAIDSYDQAIFFKKDFSEAYNNRGTVLYALKKYEAAIDSYDQAISFKKDYPEAYNNRGVALDALKKYEAAIGSYDQAISFKKDYPEAYYNRGVSYLTILRYELSSDFSVIGYGCYFRIIFLLFGTNPKHAKK